MMKYLKLFPAFFLIFFIPGINGQGFEPVQTRMPKNLVRDFVKMHMQYPETALKNNEQGTVNIAFDLNKDGKVTSKEFTKTVSPSIDSAAEKLFSLILWEPAKYMGRPIDGSGNFKVKYNIRHYESLVKKRGYDAFNYPFQPVSASMKIYTVKELDKSPVAVIDSGYQSVQEFIVSNLTIPEAAIKLHLTGVVKLRFVIEKNGLPSNIMVEEPLGGGCTEEAIRITELIRWIPGIKDDEAVRTCYNLSFTFNPSNEIKSKHIPNQSNPGI